MITKQGTKYTESSRDMENNNEFHEHENSLKRYFISF